MTVKHVEIAAVAQEGAAPTWYQYIVRGVDQYGSPFVYTDGAATATAMLSSLSSALVTNAVNWVITDDIT